MDFNNKKNIKTFMLMIFGAILFYVGLQHITVVISAAKALFSVISPKESTKSLVKRLISSQERSSPRGWIQ